MAMTANHVLRAASLAAVLMAGSCAEPFNDGKIVADPEVNHPITVEPSYATIKVPASRNLSPDDAAHFTAFVEDYLAHGNGAISISAPSGPGASDAITYFGEQLAALGVPRSRILVGTRDAADGDTRIEIGFVTYVAHTDACGNWSENTADTASNLPMLDFGCSVQNNVAVMVADPRDLMTTGQMGDVDTTRRSTVLDNFDKGQPTAATKTQDQSGTVSDVAH
jgi:pilus assembly protein CpaD